MFEKIYHIDLNFTQQRREFFLYTLHVPRFVPGNVLCHYNKHLMGYFVFWIAAWLEDNLPSFGYFEKLYQHHLFEKLESNRLHFRWNDIIPRHPEKNIFHSNKRGPPVFFHSDTNPVFGNVLVHSVSKAHLLDVTGDMIWLLFLNILSFNFVFRLIVFVLANHCQSFNAFLLDVRCLKPCVNHVSLFFAAVSANDTAFA